MSTILDRAKTFLSAFGEMTLHDGHPAVIVREMADRIEALERELEEARAEAQGMDQMAAMLETVRRICGTLEWGDVPISAAEVRLVEHIRGMPARADAGFSQGKLGRWLGWIQGAACAKGWLLLDDCKQINKQFARSVLEEQKP